METRQPTFHETVMRKLEFPEIVRRLGEACHFLVAAERALETGPSGEASQVEYLLSITDEAVDLITSFPDLTIGGARDIRDAVGRAEKGGRLQPADLLMGPAGIIRTDTRPPVATRVSGGLASLAAAITARMAQGEGCESAVASGHEYLRTVYARAFTPGMGAALVDRVAPLRRGS